ncbi:hypothetical protein S40285_05508 [Stachybotrys chlorohalonatus IBT 40285]|uniref:Derlin n=1 Tax=Stachybotrys chlorohalonatus (strain IBT 40285) TaxID=1283841 RepID=A0A084QBE7_STAC4|nr:hypothetical protein S40285_05508 [Stachybotrys chlorohalonata IBT 40285]
MSTIQENMLDAYWQLPPISRTLATAAISLSLPVHFGLLYAGWFIHHPYYLWQLPPQVWRLVTSFLITGPKLGLIFDTYLLYQYLSQIEAGHPRFQRREDVAWYLMFISGVILMTDYILSITLDVSNYFYLQGLILALAYTVTQDQRGMKASFYFITIPAQLTPYCMMLLNMLFQGPGMLILQLEGLFAAHLYDFLTRIWPEFGGGRNLLPTPAFMSRLVQTPRILQRAHGTAFRPASADSGRATGRTTGASTGPLPDSWRTRGRGQRLG